MIFLIQKDTKLITLTIKRVGLVNLLFTLTDLYLAVLFYVNGEWFLSLMSYIVATLFMVTSHHFGHIRIDLKKVPSNADVKYGVRLMPDDANDSKSQSDTEKEN